VGLVKINKKTVLSQGEPRDAAVIFDTYRIFQPHRAVSLPQHGFLVVLVCRNAGLLSTASKEVATEIALKMSSTTPLSFDAPP